MLTIFFFDWETPFKIGHLVNTWHVGDGWEGRGWGTGELGGELRQVLSSEEGGPESEVL